jgi:CRP-like cAMP-binding protein
MAAAGFADVIDVRMMIVICAMLVGSAGLLALVLPGIGTPTAAWRSKLVILRAAPAQPAFVGVRSASLADFNALVDYLPLMRELEKDARDRFIKDVLVREVTQGGTVVRQGEVGKEAYFILEGWAVAGAKDQKGQTLSLSSMGPGDFFGEIAALTDTPRTADVVAESRLTLLQVPAENLEGAMGNPRLRYLFLSTLTERLTRTHMADLPRLRGLDQDALRELRLEASGSHKS